MTLTSDETAVESTVPGVEIRGDVPDRLAPVLGPAALEFVADLARRFGPELRQLLDKRRVWQSEINRGKRPGFRPETLEIRESDWRIAPIPPDLQDRRVEITGPVDRKMVINALNSGAKVFMADFEDASSPTWANMVEGQRNLHDAIRRQVDFTADNGKRYELAESTAVLVARVRGLHLDEVHMRVDGETVPGALFDFGLYFFHNARELVDRGTGPYFYIPKLEHFEEAAWWSRVFSFAEDVFDLERGTIKATVLIETLPAAFQMDEILYHLRDHVAGLNCGRWDYIFSFIKVFHRHPECVLPDRDQVGMTRHFLRSYSKLLIRTCHRRGAFAMGGMAPQIPIADDEDANRAALEKVRADKEREVGDGHDGTWVAHPGLIPLALEVFEQGLEGPNQVTRQLDEHISPDDLLAVPDGTITEAGLRNNVAVAIRYMAAWLSGQGCVPINHLMEDAATAEIARAQLWQWIRYPGGVLDDGRDIDEALFDKIVSEEADRIRRSVGDTVWTSGRFEAARERLENIVRREDFADFLTLEAYELIV